MLKIDNLTFSYGKIQALKGVSFEVKQGEILSIVGQTARASQRC